MASAQLPRPAPDPHRARRRWPSRAPPLRPACARAGDRPRHRAHEPRGRRADWPPALAEARAARRGAGRAADAGGDARAAHQRGPRRGADRPARGAPPRQLRWRAPLRPPLGLDRRPGRDDAGRRAALRGGGRGDRAPERAAWSRARRDGALLRLPSDPTLERARGTVDRVGAQARETPRAQPPAARTDTTFVAVGGRPPAAPSGIRYVITLDADTRLPVGC